MSLKTNELIILSYINKFKKLDFEMIQKEIQAPLAQISNMVYDLYKREYLIPAENGILLTEKAKAEPVFSWNVWLEDEKLEFDGTQIYTGQLNLFGVPEIRDINQLKKILELKNVKLDYHIFNLCTGKKVRRICAPSKKLKERQRWIIKNILYKHKSKECIHGFVRRRSIVTNAMCHVGKKEILCMDISDFFPSIKFKDVVKVFSEWGYTKEVSLKLGEICTCHSENEDRFLPQGAPTSPYLANIIFEVVDDELMKYSEANGLVYTRYADDLTFSINGDNIENHIETIKCIVNRYGFFVNDSKTHVMKDNYRKIVTGLLVNERVRVLRKYKRDFEQEIYYCQKYGVSQHLCAIGRGEAVGFKDYMYGKAYFVKMVERDLGNYYLNQLDEIFND